MANSFLGLSTDSEGESRGGDYFQSKRAKDGFTPVHPQGNSGPDESRTDGPKWADDGDPARGKLPSPQLKPSV